MEFHICGVVSCWCDGFSQRHPVCLVEEIGNIYIFVHQVYFSRLDMYVYWVEALGNLDQCIRACSSLNVCIINMRVTHILLAFFMITSSNGNIFRVNGPFVRGTTGDRWIPLSKDSDAGLRRFLWCASEQTTGQAVHMAVIKCAMVLIVVSL